MFFPGVEVFGGSKGKAGGLSIVSGVGQVVGVADFHHARVFTAAGEFPRFGGFEDGVRFAREVEPVGADGQAKAGGAVPLTRAGVIFRAVQHPDCLAIRPDGGVEHVFRFPGCPLRGEDGVGGVFGKGAKLPGHLIE